MISFFQNKQAIFLNHIQHREAAIFQEPHWISKPVFPEENLETVKRNGKAGLTDTYCIIENSEVWVKGMYIAEYFYGSYNNHNSRRDRKLLLTKREIDKLKKDVETLTGKAVILNVIEVKTPDLCAQLVAEKLAFSTLHPV